MGSGNDVDPGLGRMDRIVDSPMAIARIMGKLAAMRAWRDTLGVVFIAGLVLE
jgi:hypothetical protein